MSRVLLVGEDLHLLETRAAVLARLDSALRWGSSRMAESVLVEDRVDVLVLCHTLPASEREKLISLACRRRPPTLVLQLFFDLYESQTIAESFNVRTGICEPNHLVRQVQTLLEESAKQQDSWRAQEFYPVFGTSGLDGHEVRR